MLFSWPLEATKTPNLSLTSAVFPDQVWNSCEAQDWAVWSGFLTKTENIGLVDLFWNNKPRQLINMGGKKCKSDLNWELLDNLKTFYMIRHICKLGDTGFFRLRGIKVL